jgi:hypothetical protein
MILPAPPHNHAYNAAVARYHHTQRLLVPRSVPPPPPPPPTTTHFPVPLPTMSTAAAAATTAPSTTSVTSSSDSIDSSGGGAPSRGMVPHAASHSGGTLSTPLASHNGSTAVSMGYSHSGPPLARGYNQAATSTRSPLVSGGAAAPNPASHSNTVSTLLDAPGTAAAIETTTASNNNSADVEMGLEPTTTTTAAATTSMESSQSSASLPTPSYVNHHSDLAPPLPPTECHDDNHRVAIVSNGTANVKNRSQTASTIMSPITMCFERMLGAGTYRCAYCATSFRISSPTTPLTLYFHWFFLCAAEYIKTPGMNSVHGIKKRGPLSKKVLPLTIHNTMQGGSGGGHCDSNVTSNKSLSHRNGGDPRNVFDELAEDPDLERLVILQMAMQRNHCPQMGTAIGNSMAAMGMHPVGVPSSSSGAPSLPNSAMLSIDPYNSDLMHQQYQQNQIPPLPKRDVSRVITEGFFWREYPACEQVLYNHMHRYYEISAIQKNYKVQQFFNNVLVEEVRKAAYDSGFTVDPDFCDKKLRDRIRCFYKTHLQNAKKRLATLQKHADSIENQTLVAVFIRCVRTPGLTFEESLAMASVNGPISGRLSVSSNGTTAVTSSAPTTLTATASVSIHHSMPRPHPPPPAYHNKTPIDKDQENQSAVSSGGSYKKRRVDVNDSSISHGGTPFLPSSPSVLNATAGPRHGSNNNGSGGGSAVASCTPAKTVSMQSPSSQQHAHVLMENTSNSNFYQVC